MLAREAAHGQRWTRRASMTMAQRKHQVHHIDARTTAFCMHVIAAGSPRTSEPTVRDDGSHELCRETDRSLPAAIILLTLHRLFPREIYE